VTTDPAEVAASAGFRSGLEGLAGRRLRRDPVHGFDLRHRYPPKTNFSKAAVEGYSKCKVLEVADTPIGDLSNRMGQLDDVVAVEVRQEVDLLDRRQRPLL